MADNVLFGTKIKLMAFVIVVAILPLILFGFATANVVDDYDEELSLKNAKSVSSIASEGVADYFSHLQSVSNTIANDSRFINGIVEYDEQANVDLKRLLSTEASLDAILLINNNGKISETSVWETGFNVPDFDVTKIENDIKYSNGISEIKGHTVSDRVVVSSYVKNDIGDRVGYVSLVVDMTIFIDYMKNESLDAATRLMFCDSSGNVFTSEKSSSKHYSEVGEFKSINSVLEKIVIGELDGVHHYETDSGKQMIMACAIPGTTNTTGSTWSVISVIDKSILGAQYESLSSSLNSSIFAICLIDVIIIIIFVFWFTRPISNVMRLMSGGEINISSQRVIVNGSTELDNINRQINVLLDALSESEQRYRTVVDMTDNIVFEYAVKKDNVSFSNNFNKKFSFRANSSKYEDSFFVKAVVYDEDLASYKKFIASMLEGHTMQGEFRFKTIYNDYAWYLIKCASIRDSYNSIIKIVGVMLNIDKTKAREQVLMNKASLDPLTQAYNRESFELALVNEYELSAMRNGKDAVLFIDLDNFKQFNDEYNHTVGDEVLMFTVNLIKQLVQKNGFVGRYGGDEFVVCFREASDFTAATLAQKIITGMSDGFVSASTKQHIVMFCSIGIAYLEGDVSEPSEIIDRADNAMYSVKRSGKSNFAVYKPE